MTDDKSEFYRARISDIWADIRSYGSNIWQITALTLAASALVANLISRPDSEGSLLFFSLAGWVGFLIVTWYLFFSTIMVSKISAAIKQRVESIGRLIEEVGFKEITRTVTELKEGGFGISLGEEMTLSDILNWMPTNYIVNSHMLMWVFSISLWYIQVPLTFYGDLLVTLILLLIQSIIVIGMIWAIWREQRDKSTTLVVVR